MNLIRKLSKKDIISIAVFIGFDLFLQIFMILNYEVVYIDENFMVVFYLRAGVFLFLGLGLGLFIAYTGYNLSRFKAWAEFILVGSYGLFLLFSHPYFRITFKFSYLYILNSYVVGSGILGYELVSLPVRLIRIKKLGAADKGNNNDRNLTQQE